MNKQKWILLLATLALMATAGGMLFHSKANQKLGTPGIKAVPIPGSVVMQIDLPERVLDCLSTNVPQQAVVTNMLPPDTSYASRCYYDSNGFWITANIVMMGKDRSSIHKPEYCLPGQGFKIESQTNLNLSIAGPQPYQLTVARWIVSKPGTDMRGIYVFWFVAENELTTDYRQRMWLLARDLLLRGVLQRWAYVSYFAVCQAGQEEAAFARVSELIARSVPEFQLPLPSASANVAAGR